MLFRWVAHRIVRYSCIEARSRITWTFINDLTIALGIDRDRSRHGEEWITTRQPADSLAVELVLTNGELSIYGLAAGTLLTLVACLVSNHPVTPGRTRCFTSIRITADIQAVTSDRRAIPQP